MKNFLKKVWESFKEHFVWIIVTVFITAILDLIGLGGKSDIGLGFILGFLLLAGLVIYAFTKKEKTDGDSRIS